MRFFLIFLLSFAILQSKELLYDNLHLKFEPSNYPMSFPKDLVPKEFQANFYTEFKENSAFLKELTLLGASTINFAELSKFYRSNLNREEWKLLQSSSSETEFVYLAEGFGKRSFTVVGKKDGNITKLYFVFKRNRVSL